MKTWKITFVCPDVTALIIFEYIRALKAVNKDTVNLEEVKEKEKTR